MNATTESRPAASPRFVRSRHLQVEQQHDDQCVLVHGLLGHRLQVNSATQRFLDAFAQPRHLEELLPSGAGAPEAVQRSFEQLCRAGFLVDETHRETLSDKQLQRVTPGFFNCPSLPLSRAAETDAALLGVPFDYGNHKEPGARYGAAALRRWSCDGLHYLLDPQTQRPQGWYDNEFDRPLLGGVRLGDLGNLFATPNEAPEQVFHKLTDLVRQLLSDNVLPVVIGGDHSITYACVRAYEKPVAVLQIDAHSDLAPYHGGVANHHGNVMSRVLALETVCGLHQVGLRGVTNVAQLSPGRRGVETTLSPRQLRRIGLQGLLERLPADLEYYVSLDIDAIDPIHAPATSTPVPGGFDPVELKEMLWGIARERRCVGFDLVEINPRRDVNDLTLAVAQELLLAFLGGHFDERQPTPPTTSDESVS